MEKFIKFLKENNAWEKFEKNFIKQGTDVKEYKEACKTPKNWELVMAFTWANTDEGFPYWRALNNKWWNENPPT